VGFVSRPLDVACWRAHLTTPAAAALAASPSFFYVGPLPAVAKLAPTLIERRVASSDVLHVDPLVMGEGVAVFLDPEAPLEARKYVL
jgi:hypothetical protein